MKSKKILFPLSHNHLHQHVLNRKYIIGLLLHLSCYLTYAGEIDGYMLEYRNSGKSDFSKEIELIKSHNLDKLVNELTPFYSDTLVKVRQKAYYLTYKKGIAPNIDNRQIAVSRLLEGCEDKDGGITGQNLGYLQSFSPLDFSVEDLAYINILLGKKKVKHYVKLVLLAGYLNTGSETLNRKLLQDDINPNIKWAIRLALARQGSEEHIQYCLRVAQKAPIGNQIVEQLVPDLVYTRQKELLDYCVELMNSDKEACYSADPDNPQNILCGYRIMELIAPVIKDFIYKTDGTGSIITNNYKTALQESRKWFKNNPEYDIITNTF